MRTGVPERDGQRRSTEELMPEVYDALRQLAMHRMKQQRPGQTISGTELVHEVYLRLQKEGSAPKWANRKQFFSAAAEAMRRILIDRIRAKERIKRGGGQRRLDVNEIELAMPTEDRELVEISEALDELAKSDPQSADLVKLRFFAGMTLEQIAEATEVSVRTVTRRWTYARAWLADYLEA
ncbi:MAG: ECF-type sigma factor [Planctomycetota bacterium]